MLKRWLFVWRDMRDPKEVDRMIARFPRARAAGYNGVAFAYDIPASKAVELREAAKKHRRGRPLEGRPLCRARRDRHLPARQPDARHERWLRERLRKPF